MVYMNKNNNKNNKTSSKKKEYIFYTIILIIFITLVSIVSLKHEYWADEANAWLIAADSSIIELFTKYLHTDGHPALFHLIIKFFQFFGLKYNNFRIISIIFSSLGVGLFLFKSNYKWYLKALIPFTYFIFYQYTVVTRGYCLVLLLLSCIAILWEKRKEKCILFTIFTILLLSLESYTFLIAGSIYLLSIIDYIKEYKQTKKHDKKLLTCLIVLFLAFLLTTIYVMPRSSNTFNPSNTIYYISNSFIIPFNASVTLKNIGTLIIIIIIGYLLVKNPQKILETFILLTPLLCFMSYKYCNLWHTGIMFLMILFIAWIHNYHKFKIFNIFMLLTCIIQIYWTINTSIYDYKESYSPAKEIADFIKTQDYENMKIYAAEFYESAINAYFDKNIFYNWNQDVRFFYWNKNNIYYELIYDAKTLLKENIDMIIITPTYQDIDRKIIKKHYDEYIFDGSTYFQTEKYESMKVYVYIKKDNQSES